MRDGEWTLSVGSQSVTFGPADSLAFLSGPPDLGDVEISVQDAPLIGADGVVMGADLFGGRTIVLSLKISRKTEAEAYDALATLRALWRGDAVRSTPGSTATLSVRRAGRERLVYGRPRKFVEDLDAAPDGLIGVTASFETTGPTFYGTTESSTSVTLVPPTGGGFFAPFTFPLTSSASSDRSRSFTVDGVLPAWPIVEIRGPITAPSVEVVGRWKMTFPSLSLAFDQTLVVDTRPWARTILRNGASVAGAVSRSSVRLSDAALPPGSYEFVLSGSSEAATATARLRWRATYPTL